jgi:hypothetical protein
MTKSPPILSNGIYLEGAAQHDYATLLISGADIENAFFIRRQPLPDRSVFWSILIVGIFIFGLIITVVRPNVLVAWECEGRIGNCVRYVRCDYLGPQGWQRFTPENHQSCPLVKVYPINLSTQGP